MVEDHHMLDIINILHSPKTKVSSSVTENLKNGACPNELGNLIGFACTAIAYGSLLTGQYFKPCQYDKTKNECPLKKYP